MRTVLDAARPGLDEAYSRVMASGHLILGAELEAFESEFAEYCGVRYCVGVGNGLDALVLTLRARGIGPGDEVIVPAQTFIASWLAVSMTGATIVPVDVETQTCNLDPAAAAAAITPRTRAIMAVHLFGHPADMHRLRATADQHGLFLLEDAAQAHGARIGDRRCGSFGDAAAFSFYPTKNLGCLGDGGAVVTNDGDLCALLRKLRNYGSTRKYVHDVAAGNSRLDELQAAFLRVRLPLLGADNARRYQIAERYKAHLRKANGIVLPQADSQYDHAYHLFVVRMANRDRSQLSLQAKGIAAQIHYPTPPHLQPAYASLGMRKGTFPEAESWANECLSLPLWPQMSNTHVDMVANAILAG
jgi:dTDP-4-amino-4,6-dideoxygalactose transaminase